FRSVAMIVVGAYGIIHEPVIDFRDYKIGTDLRAEKAKIAKNPSQYKTFYSLKNAETGEVLKVNQDDYIKKTEYWAEGSPWKIEEGKNESVLVKEGYKSEIAKFKLEDTSGTDLTQQIINTPKTILIFTYYPQNVSPEVIKQLETKIKTQGTTAVYGVSTLPNTFKTIKNLMMDATAIKTIARSNPFVLVLENGKIVDKQPAKDYLK
ncbi:MAG TPA: doxx family protein, partial [Chryseobacterium sp.]|nr:doxx family protein [Chryseobacterium sp.]